MTLLPLYTLYVVHYTYHSCSSRKFRFRHHSALLCEQLYLFWNGVNIMYSFSHFPAYFFPSLSRENFILFPPRRIQTGSITHPRSVIFLLAHTQIVYWGIWGCFVYLLSYFDCCLSSLYFFSPIVLGCFYCVFVQYWGLIEVGFG